MIQKQKIIKKVLQKEQLDAFLFFSPENRFWLTNFQSSLGYLLALPLENYLLVDGRYITTAQRTARNCQVQLWRKLTDIKQLFEKLQVKSVGFEKGHITVEQLEQLKKQITNVDWVGVNTSKLRMIKTKEEIDRIKQAAKITDQAYQSFLKKVKIGMSEKDLAELIEALLKKQGAEKLSFDTIVVSGQNGALPHGQPSEKLIREGELITVDFGCKYQGFCSDFTRTFATGEEINLQLKEIYQIVQQAQWKGIQAVKSGLKCSEIDQIVRKYIQAKGYNEYFVHSTGHGLGIEVHEEPSISAKDKTILQPGMIITIEPGIYIPNLGGVRIEDDVLVTENGYELLTKSTRELIYI